jgi:hypothetical protein
MNYVDLCQALDLTPDRASNLFKVPIGTAQRWRDGFIRIPPYIEILLRVIKNRGESVDALCELQPAKRWQVAGGDRTCAYSEGATRYREALREFELAHSGAARYFGVSLLTSINWAKDHTNVPHAVLLLCGLLKKHNVSLADYKREKDPRLTAAEKEEVDKKELELLDRMIIKGLNRAEKNRQLRLAGRADEIEKD